jgi:hypothetical protein
MENMQEIADRINAQFHRYGLSFDVVRVHEAWDGEQFLEFIDAGNTGAMHNLSISLEILVDAFHAQHPEQGGQLRLF